MKAFQLLKLLFSSTHTVYIFDSSYFFGSNVTFLLHVWKLIGFFQYTFSLEFSHISPPFTRYSICYLSGMCLHVLSLNLYLKFGDFFENYHHLPYSLNQSCLRTARKEIHRTETAILKIWRFRIDICIRMHAIYVTLSFIKNETVVGMFTWDDLLNDLFENILGEIKSKWICFLNFYFDDFNIFNWFLDI